MDLFLQLLANGLVIGAFYALSALGLTLVFGLMRVVNFAHGELYVIGGLLGWALTAVLGWNYFLALVVVVVEDDDIGEFAIGLIAALRRAGLATETVATGSTKKRFDKATKLNPVAILSLNTHLLGAGEFANAKYKEVAAGFALSQDQRQNLYDAIASIANVGGLTQIVPFLSGRELPLKRKS